MDTYMDTFITFSIAGDIARKTSLPSGQILRTSDTYIDQAQCHVNDIPLLMSCAKRYVTCGMQISKVQWTVQTFLKSKRSPSVVIIRMIKTISLTICWTYPLPYHLVVGLVILMIATQACKLQLRFSISDQNLHFIHIILQTFAYHISTVVPAKNSTSLFISLRLIFQWTCWQWWILDSFNLIHMDVVPLRRKENALIFLDKVFQWSPL